MLIIQYIYCKLLSQLHHRIHYITIYRRRSYAISYWPKMLRYRNYQFIHSSTVRKLPLAVHPFDPIRSKIFFSSSAVRPYPFENFLHPFSRSTSSVRKFSLSVQPFDLIRSKIFCIRSAVRFIRFERLAYLFLIRSLPVRSAVLTDTVRHVFAGEVTYN